MRKILVVDDEPTIVSIIEDVLQLNGMEAMGAADADEAEQMLKRVRPDLILLDVMMPKTNGFMLCEKLKSIPEYKDIPIIFVTVMSKKKDMEKGLALGAVDFITKPFDPEDLVKRVKKVLGDSV